MESQWVIEHHFDEVVGDFSLHLIATPQYAASLEVSCYSVIEISRRILASLCHTDEGMSGLLIKINVQPEEVSPGSHTN